MSFEMDEFVLEYVIPVREYFKRVDEFEKTFEINKLSDELYCKIFEGYVYLEHELKGMEQIINKETNEQERLVLEKEISKTKFMRKNMSRMLDAFFKIQRNNNSTQNAYMDSQLKVSKISFQQDDLKDYIFASN